MELRTKEYKLELKSLDAEAGTFEGYLSVYGNTDLQKEVVEPGAWHVAMNPLPLLYRHDRNQLIGAIDELLDDDKGLFIKGHLNLNVARAKEVYALMQEGLITGLSPGFQETKDSFVGDIRHIIAANMYEASLTPFPANPVAGVTHFKELDGEIDVKEHETDSKKEADLDFLGDEPIVFEKSVQGSGLPLADKGVKWDEGATRKALNGWAGDDINKYARAFLFYDGSGKTTGCKLPIATIVNGRLVAVPAAIHAAKSRFDQTQGIPADQKAAIQRIIDAYSKKLGWDEADDEAEDQQDQGAYEAQENEPAEKPKKGKSKGKEATEEPAPPEMPDNSGALKAQEEYISDLKTFNESIGALNEVIGANLKEHTEIKTQTP